MTIQIRINIAYALLLRCLEDYNPTFNDSGIILICPAFMDGEESFKILINVSKDFTKYDNINVYDSNNENIQINVSKYDSNETELMIVFKDKVIKKKLLLDNFERLITKGFIQTLNCLHTLQLRKCPFIYPNKLNYVNFNCSFVDQIAGLTYSSVKLNEFKIVGMCDISFKSFFTNEIIKIEHANIKSYFECLLNLSNPKNMKRFIDESIINVLPNEVKMVSESNLILYEKKHFRIKCSYGTEEILIKFCEQNIKSNEYIPVFNVQWSGQNFNIIEDAIRYIDSLNYMLDYLDIKNIICKHTKPFELDSCKNCILRRMANSRISFKKLIISNLHQDLYKHLFAKKYNFVLDEIENWSGFKKSAIAYVDVHKYTTEQYSNLSANFKNNIHLLKICGIENFLTYFSYDLSTVDINYLNELKRHQINLDEICESLS